MHQGKVREAARDLRVGGAEQLLAVSECLFFEANGLREAARVCENEPGRAAQRRELEVGSSRSREHGDGLFGLRQRIVEVTGEVRELRLDIENLGFDWDVMPELLEASPHVRAEEASLVELP